MFSSRRAPLPLMPFLSLRFLVKWRPGNGKLGDATMTDDKDEFRQLRAQQRFLDEIEQGIRFANRELIRSHIPKLDKDTILALAVSVGRLRARYLEAAFRLSGSDHGELPASDKLEKLSSFRSQYEEAKTAFEALRDAIEKGYIDVHELQGAGKDK